MLHSSKTLAGYTLTATDGSVGRAQIFYFDDRDWSIRYLIAETGSFLVGRQVLIAPYSLLGVDPASMTIGISLSKAQIENSPSLDTDKPVSQQFAEECYEYYGWPAYWHAAKLVGPFDQSAGVLEAKIPGLPEERSWDIHLRSTGEVDGYIIEAEGSAAGHIVDLIIDPTAWTIRYLVAETGPWWGGRRILIAPSWIESISCLNKKVSILLKMEQIKLAPEYKEPFQITREYEASLHRHYNLQGYWVDEPTELPAVR